MAPTMLRHVARSAFASSSRLSAAQPFQRVAPVLARSLATEAQDSRPQAKARPINPISQAHTVEELHGATVQEILREGGSRKEASMRHFTGTSKSGGGGGAFLLLFLRGSLV